MISVSTIDNRFVLDVSEAELAPRHASQLAYWGFWFNSDQQQFISSEEIDIRLVLKVTNYLTRCDLVYDLRPEISSLLEQNQNARAEISSSLAAGGQLKDGEFDMSATQDFQSFLDQNIPRKLKDHQFKAALHLLTVRNGANFSVPGSGKTTVVLSVFQKLRILNEIDALFVVGPPACFAPWRREYEKTLGVVPDYEIFAGGDIEARHDRYLTNIDSVYDLYLTTFHTLSRDWELVRTLFDRQGLRFFFVIDEAHYIKQLGGSWANAALKIAPFARRRCILTGTPFPKSYVDSFNLFDFLWPDVSPISEQRKHQISHFTQRRALPQAAEVLNESIGPLFYRVRKVDLNLAPQVFHEPMLILMNPYERRVYDLILDRIRQVSQTDYMRDLDVLMNLRRGRMIRLRQCLSYTALLGTAVDHYNETLLEENPSIADIIKHYDDLETPAKLEALIILLGDLQQNGEKVVIWSNFVRTLELIHMTALNLGYGARLIYGATPTQNANVDEELTREGIISDFINPESGVDILVANPAACAESISLHTTCSNAIYYDLSYNCAQYLQSLDRIHRVGGSENKQSYYQFLQYEDTLDQDILTNLQAKGDWMSHIIDQEYPIYSLDMFADDEVIEAYERIFG